MAAQKNGRRSNQERKMALIQDEQSRSGCTRTEKARHWRWISWDVLLTYCSRMQAGDAWFLNTPEQSLSFILADQGFVVWVGNVRGTRWSHGHRSYLVKNKKFWDWSWQELALYDMAEMINYIYLVTNSKLFIVGHSQALGLAYQRLCRYTAAIKSYGRAIELDDKMVFALVESENISLTLGSFRKGVKQFRQALEISSQCMTAQYGLALGLLYLAKDCMNMGAFNWGLLY
ncbi:hypothetical protein Ahy_A06g030040 [Arachis hypogaea]|uniref:Uncharacterized protein n=1 Tax=Arachis hypogaea TaxID=3818 RepID=A0A445CUZ6_ARAHY|nr:hypothetical protein Ahy_A06g030040 [Arachis hypogaea]